MRAYICAQVSAWPATDVSRSSRGMMIDNRIKVCELENMERSAGRMGVERSGAEPEQASEITGRG